MRQQRSTRKPTPPGGRHRCAVTEALEHDLILDIMGEIRDAHVLDAGCGDGTLVCAMSSRGAEVTGIDPDPAMLAAARARIGRESRQGSWRDESNGFPFRTPPSMS